MRTLLPEPMSRLFQASISHSARVSGFLRRRQGLRVFRFVAVVLAASLLSGCYKPPRAHIDTSVPVVGYDDVPRPPRPQRVFVSFEFLQNGLRHLAGEAGVRPIVLQVLRGTGMFLHDEDAPDGRMRVVLNDIGDVEAGQAQALLREFVPLTGLLNATLTDRYEMSVTVTQGGVTRSVAGLKHTLYLVMGVQDLPPGAQPVPIPVAVQQIVETLLLTALRDLQQVGGSSTTVASRHGQGGQE